MPKKIDTYFSLYDEASLFAFNKQNPETRNKKKSESTIILPEKVRDNLEAKYYQLLDMVWYRKLPDGLPRRLYEYLEKRRYHNINGTFSISESALCRWLPINTHHVTERRKTLAHIAQALIDARYLLSYKFDKTKKLCNFVYAKKLPLESLTKLASEDVPTQENKQARENQQLSLSKPEVSIQETKVQPSVQEIVTPENHKLYLEAIEWLDKIPYFHKARKQEIAAKSLNEVAKLFPKIQAEYERLKSAGKAPKAGWIYKAFMEAWEFVAKSNGAKGKSEKDLAEDRKNQTIEEAFSQLPEERQERLKQEFQEAHREFPEMTQQKWVWLRYIERAVLPKVD